MSSADLAAPAGASDPSGSATPDLLAGFAAACVPAFCDGLRVELSAGAEIAITATYPRAPQGTDPNDGHFATGERSPAAVGGHPADDSAHVGSSTSPSMVEIAVRSEPMLGQPPIVGTIVLTWRDRGRPSEADMVLARLLADQAVATVRLDGLGMALEMQLSRAANLEQALATNREIGQAIGILMVTDHLTSTQAFERLRTASQHAHRKLRAIAADVVETGVLTGSGEPARAPTGVPARGPDRPARPPSPRIQRRTQGGQPCLVMPPAAAVLSAD